MTDALFEPDGDRLIPTDFARGPWDPRALHGGPTGALLARAIESAPTDGIAFEVARLTVELLRPVPVEPLVLAAEVVRPGPQGAAGRGNGAPRRIGQGAGPCPRPADPVGAGG